VARHRGIHAGVSDAVKAPTLISHADFGFSAYAVNPGMLERRGEKERPRVDYQCWGTTVCRAGMEDGMFDLRPPDLAIFVNVIEHVPLEDRHVTARELLSVVTLKRTPTDAVDLLGDGAQLRSCVITKAESPLVHGTFSRVNHRCSKWLYKNTLRSHWRSWGEGNHVPTL
jgi:hypothetical protein